MSKSKIEWTDRTWNPTVGCSKVSQGCKNCYALTMSARIANAALARDDEPTEVQKAYMQTVQMENGKYVPKWTGDIGYIHERLREPFQWQKNCRVFVDSMTDLFHPNISFQFLDKIFAIMALNPQHIFQILTKRPERMADYFKSKVEYPYYARTDEYTAEERISVVGGDFIRKYNLDPDNFEYEYCDHPEMPGAPTEEWYNCTGEWPLPNVWLGTSVENQEAANERIPHLLECPAAVRFLSCEPLLAPVNLSYPVKPEEIDYEIFNRRTMFKEGWREPVEFETEAEYHMDWINYSNCRLVESKAHEQWRRDRMQYIKKISLGRRIHWVIAGGESGPAARPMHPNWVRELREQCKLENTPFFFKQWGAWVSEMHPKADPSSMPTDDRFVTYVDRESNEVETKEEADDYYGQYMVRVGKKKAGRELDGKEWNQSPGVGNDS